MTKFAPSSAARHGQAEPPPLLAGDSIGSAFEPLRRTLLLRHCKWDPQVGDCAAIAPFPLLLEPWAWDQLRTAAEALAAELIAAETELLHSPGLHRRLGISRPLRRALRAAAAPQPAAARVIRFDFHWTTVGWQISEANADVPGGFCEASVLPRLMAEHCAGTATTGDPAARWVEAIAAVVPPHRTLALLTAPGYMEDHQVVSHLAALLEARGIGTRLAQPGNLLWGDQAASLPRGFGVNGPLGGIVRFFQAEWLCTLPRHSQWWRFFSPPCAVFNPAYSILSESKRFALTWDLLGTPLPTWRTFFPETVDPRSVSWKRRSGWVLKAAYSNTGDAVLLDDQPVSQAWRRSLRAARWFPGNWVAQRRFHSLPIATPLGERYPCLGVYTVNGKAAGTYGRLSSGPVVDSSAVDVAILIRTREDRTRANFANP